MREYFKYLTSWLIYRLKGGIPMPPSPLRLEIYQDWNLYSYKRYHRIKVYREYWVALIEADELDNIFDMKHYNYRRFAIRYNQ